METWAWILFWLLLFLLFFLLLFVALARRGFPCLLCDLFGPHKPEFGSDRAPPKRGSIRVPSDVYKRPDPLIYSQQFLMSQGLAVTWDNPDIWLETVNQDGDPSGVVVSSHELTADTDYFILARIWNGSVEAPAIDLPVHFSYLSFGIGQGSQPIGTTQVDLPVKGAAGCPARAAMKWRTPAAAGHYCLQVLLEWADDAEPSNNLGQENTDVKALNSPHAAFSFPVRNDSGMRRVLHLAADFYRPGERPRCKPDQPRASQTRLSVEEIASRRRLALAEHGAANFPLPAGWTVKLLPDEVILGPGEQETVTVDVTAPDGFSGQQAINVNALAGNWLAGGVTLVVTGS
jgi:hypothetical protein